MRHGIALAAVLAALAASASAHAVDTFVDPDTGFDTNNCTQAAPGSAGVGPCETVQAAVTKAIPGGTVRVDRGDTYLENVSLSGGVSVLGADLNPSDTGVAVVDGNTAGPAFTVPAGQAAETVQGLTIRANATGLTATGTIALIAQNSFDDSAPGNDGIVLQGANNTVIDGNSFPGDGTSNERAIRGFDGSAVVRNNTITNHYLGIEFDGTGGASATSTPAIAANTITGTHQGSSAGAGILISDGTYATLIRNSVSAPGAGTRLGILINGLGGEATTGATLNGNTVRGAHTHAIDIRDTRLPTMSTSDLVTGATGVGLYVDDQAPETGSAADITVNNLTAWGNAQDILTARNALTVDSSITQDAISFPAGTTCAISFSRGPAITPGGSGCADFQTTADPLFVNAGAGNFHLQATSPMIDAGNPAAPGGGAVDFDGDPRALDATPLCPLVQRRDIGADELFVAQPVCAIPVVPPVVQPIANAPKPKVKKCKTKKKKRKKGAKGKGKRAAAAAKKCKSKKKRKKKRRK